MMATTSPPTTGAGMQKVSRKRFAKKLSQHQDADSDGKGKILVNLDCDHDRPSLLSGCLYSNAAFLVVLCCAGMERDRD